MSLKYYVQLVKPFRKTIFLLVGLSLLTALLQLPIPLAFKYLIDTVLPKGQLGMLCLLIGLMLALIIGGSLIGLWATLISIKTHQLFRSSLRQSLYAQVQRLPFDVYSHFMSGELTSRLIKDLDCLSLLLPSGIAGFIRNSALSFGFVVVLLCLNWQMTLWLSVTIPFFILVFVLAQKQLRKLSLDTHQAHSTMQSGLQEKIEGLRDIQLTNSQEFQEADAKRVIEDSEASISKLHIQQAKVDTSMVAFHLVGTFVIWGIGGWMVLQHRMSVGEIVGFSYAVNYVFGPFSSLFQYVSGIQFELAALDRLTQIFEFSPSHTLEAETSDAIKGHIQFEHVSFGYSEKPEVLEDISFEVRAGESMAILGPSGSGKTTLISLLVKLITPSSGRILIDGQDISTLSDFTLRQWIGFVPQDVFLFQGSLKDNILMGRQVSIELWQKVCWLSGVAELAGRLDQGFESIVGEKGSYLSGGERQRVAIARALLTDPQIIVLDEPSNNLDGEAKARLHQSLILAKEGKTLIVVTHDLALTQGISKRIELNKKVLKDCLV